MSKISLKKRIISILVLAGLSLVLILSLVVFLYLNKELTSQKINETSKLSTEQIHESAAIMTINQNFVKMLASQTEVRECLKNYNETNGKKLLSIFSGYVQEDDKFLAVYLLDKNGIGLVSTDERFVGQDYSFRDYFKKALAGELIVDAAIGKTSNVFGYYFSVPVKDEQGDIIGVLVAKIDNKNIDNSILNSEISKNSTVMLTDQYGIILASNKADRFLKSLGVISGMNKEVIRQTNRVLGQDIKALQYDNVQKVIDNYKGAEVTKFYDTVDKEQESIFTSKIGNFPFYLVSEIGLDSVNNFVLSIVLIIILIVVLGIFLFSLTIAKVVLALISPLKKFEVLSEAVGAGDFSKKIEITTKSEFSDLAEVFNKMVSNLKESHKHLDKKVEERTLEIENKSKEMEEQRKAIVNILEDVEIEKDNAELLAQDLEKFKLAVDSASDQVVISDPEGIVVYGNHAVEKITGYKPEEALGKKAAVLWKQPMSSEYYQNMWNTIKKKKAIFIGEIKNKRKNGELYDATISISPVLNNKNEIVYFVAIEHDITKEKEIDKAKTEFVSLASHQLRTPLSAINWYTEMLLAGDAGKINDEQRQYLNEVAIGNQRMVDLVDSLLNVSRLDLGTFIIEPELLDIVEMSKSVITEMTPTIKEKELKVEQSYTKEIKEFNADKKLLRIVFQNLISNAVKYTLPNGSVKVAIAKALKGELFGGVKMKKDSVTIAVTDSGMGIPAGQQNKIFSKMFRADNARESETEGTGLGLYIIKSIVDHSDGLIWFESKENIGTTFYVTFLLSGMKKKEGSKKLD